MRYTDFETLLDLEGLEWRPEFRLFAEHVGTGPGLRSRLEEAGLKDFRFDYVFPNHSILVEIQGSGFSHQHRLNQQRDWKKCNDAVKLGWYVMYFPAARVTKHPESVVDEILAVIESHEKSASK